MIIQEKIFTRTASIWLDADGVLRVQGRPGSAETGADACENVAALLKAAQGRRCRLIVDISAVKSIDRDARREYTRIENAQVSSACALVVGSPLSRMIGNFFIGLNRSVIPTRLFSSTEAAMQWLRDGAVIAA